MHIIYLALGGVALVAFSFWLYIQRRNRQWPFNCGNSSHAPSSAGQGHGDYKPPQAMAAAQAAHAAPAEADAQYASAPPYPKL